MSSSTSSTNSAPASAPASATASAMNSSTVASKIPLYALIGFGFAGYIASFVMTSQFLGSADNWKAIQPIFSTIYGPALGGTILLCIALGIYINQMINSVNVIYIIMVISVLALCFSYIAVAMAVITKSA